MVKIPHSLQFVTEIDETSEIGMRLLQLHEVAQIALLESMLKELLAPALKPALDEINEGSSWAVLKVAE